MEWGGGEGREGNPRDGSKNGSQEEGKGGEDESEWSEEYIFQVGWGGWV